MGCTFCGTGKFFGRDLSVMEIISQVAHMIDSNKIDQEQVKQMQIMVMSMGEPLLNMKSVSQSFSYFDNHFPKAKLLVSTSAPKTNDGWFYMMELAEYNSNVGLQFSVHESTDEARNKIMPMKAKLNLEQISLKGLEFYKLTGRKPFFNYCVSKENSSAKDINNLRMLFDPRVWEATLSVICESDQAMSDAVLSQVNLVSEFSGKLIDQGFNTRVFDPAGQDDIGGGCGQLWAVQDFAKNNSSFKQSAGNKILCKNI
jgi:23S rRNA (adenine2503-C2)-methyltransferase